MDDARETIALVRPAPDYWPSMANALRKGWSPENLRPEAAAETLEKGLSNLAGYLAGLDDRTGAGPPVRKPDGSFAPRLPWFQRWLWDGVFCGVISLRWQSGTDELPSYVLGHIGYAVVPWKRRRGYATAALGLLLPQAKDVGLRKVQVTCDATNDVSQKVITRQGGVLCERFVHPLYGPTERLRYTILL